MSERIRGSYDDALYKSTYTLLYFTGITATPKSAAITDEHMQDRYLYADSADGADVVLKTTQVCRY